LILHLLLIFSAQYFARVPKFEEDVVEVIPIDLKSIDARDLRIADIDKPDLDKKPDKPKFLGMYDSSVKEESVATGAVAKKGGDGRAQKRPQAQEAGPLRSEKAPKKDIFAVNRKDFQEGKDGSGKRSGDSASPSGDFFPDFKRGARTYLNVLRYPDVDYFVRMKRAFRMTFNPAPSLSNYFSSNHVSVGSVEVVLGVSVDKNGELSELFVFRSSGIAGYDEEALRTVRASSPFSTPPSKFVDDDGILRMSWTFTVYL
jgi:TonB family protein